MTFLRSPLVVQAMAGLKTTRLGRLVPAPWQDAESVAGALNVAWARKTRAALVKVGVARSRGSQVFVLYLNGWRGVDERAFNALCEIALPNISTPSLGSFKKTVGASSFHALAVTLTAAALRMPFPTMPVC